jgi:hypothetical protein
MGGSVSTVTLPTEDTHGNARSIEELSNVLMPIYFIEEPISNEEKEKAVRSWKMIASGQAAEFYRLKKADPANVPCSTPMEFFGNRFIQRFFEVHPIAAPMFSKTSMKQGTLFFRMVSFTIAALDDDSKFDSQFVTLAKSHNRMGIRAVECTLLFVYYLLCRFLCRMKLTRPSSTGSCFQMASSVNVCFGC